MPRRPGRAAALEIRRGQIVDNHLGAQRKQIAQPEEQLLFDRRLVRGQSVEGTIPAVELGVLDAHSRAPAPAALLVVAPGRQPAAAAAVTDELGFQPARQPVLARGRAQAVGDQHQGAIGQPRLSSRGRSLEAVENVFQAELLEGLAEGQQASPGGGLFGGGEPAGVDPAAGAVEQPDEGVQLGAELVLAAQADDDPLAAAAAIIAVGLDELDVFVDFGRGAADAGEAPTAVLYAAG